MEYKNKKAVQVQKQAESCLYFPGKLEKCVCTVFVVWTGKKNRYKYTGR